MARTLTSIKTLSRALFLGAFLTFQPAALANEKPVVYNNMVGDGSRELDSAIKGAYGARYSVVDVRAKEGYAEPTATAGSMPREFKDDKGVSVVGYVLMAYIVDSNGFVADPVALKSSDARLTKVALDSMAKWRFLPARLWSVPVASTAAQEFSFGPLKVETGFTLKRLILYQSTEVVMRRMPPRNEADAYLDRLTEVAHNFFVGNPTPETLHIIVLLIPGQHSRIWFLSSVRPGDAKELAPLKALLEAVTPIGVKEGPVLFTLSGVVMGGDGNELPAGQSPVPAQWRELEGKLREPLPMTGDAFLSLAYTDSP
jgi:hypothetical protein